MYLCMWNIFLFLLTNIFIHVLQKINGANSRSCLLGPKNGDTMFVIPKGATRVLIRERNKSYNFLSMYNINIFSVLLIHIDKKKIWSVNQRFLWANSWDTKRFCTPLELHLSLTFCSTDPPTPLPPFRASNSSHSPPSDVVLIGKAGDHYILRAQYLQPIEWVQFLPKYYNSWNGSRIQGYTYMHWGSVPRHAWRLGGRVAETHEKCC